MIIAWDSEAWADYLYWQSQDKKTLKRMFGLYFAKKNALIASGYPFSRKDSTRRRLK